MTIKEYHEYPALSRSRLWHLRQSPQKFKYAEEHPETPTPALRLGAAFHKIALEPETFDQEYIIAPDTDRRTSEGKRIYAAFLEQAAQRTVITYEDVQTIIEMSRALMANPTAKYLVETGLKEQSIFWTDKESGIDLKCRPDILIANDDLHVIVDLKSCNSADTDSFTKECLRLGYDVQAAMYSEGVQTKYPGEYAFMFIAVEKNPPYAVNIMEMDKLVVDYGYVRFRELLDLYAECKKNNDWYGFNGTQNIINKIQLPAWVQ